MSSANLVIDGNHWIPSCLTDKTTPWIKERKKATIKECSVDIKNQFLATPLHIMHHMN